MGTVKFSIRIISLVLFMLMFTGCWNKDENTIPAPQPAKTNNPLVGKTIPAFNATDLQGQPVTESIFKDNKLTMLNLWGTFCGPCIKEMPDIEKLQNRYRDRNVLVLGVVVDRDLAAARRIVSTQKAAYTSIIPDSSLESSVVSAFDYVPATIFIDASGSVLNPMVSGSNSFEGYSVVIESLLKEMETAGGTS